MPRALRPEEPNGIFHIATRSIFEGRAFTNAADRWDFIGTLARVVELCNWRCKSYCLMGTHYHLVVQTPQPNLSYGMQLLNGRYAQKFNRRHGRRGHLFDSRFYSVLIQTDTHLLTTLRYLARNPVTAGLCEAPADWRWSSYRALVGLDPALRLLDVEGVLDLFSGSREGARAQFVRLVEDTPDAAMPVAGDLAAIDGV